MNVLLDTHALIWWFEGSPSLSKRASSIMASPSNAILISAVIGWELAIKLNAGKFHTPSLVQDLGGIVAREGFAELPINWTMRSELVCCRCTTRIPSIGYLS